MVVICLKFVAVEWSLATVLLLLHNRMKFCWLHTGVAFQKNSGKIQDSREKTLHNQNSLGSREVLRLRNFAQL